MYFREFLREHAGMMPAVNFDPFKPGFIDLARTWNAEAMFRPENCDDIVQWPEGDEPVTIPNPYKKGAKKKIDGGSKEISKKKEANQEANQEEKPVKKAATKKVTAKA